MGLLSFVDGRIILKCLCDMWVVLLFVPGWFCLVLCL